MNHLEQRYTLLIVDDEPLNIDVLFGLLEADYEIKAATSGQTALEVLSKGEKPDLILLDVMMPDMDGYELCRQLKASPNYQSIPVIFVTAKSDPQSEEIGFNLGAVDYISKPIIPSIVKARVASQLALHNQNRELRKLVAERTQEIATIQLKLVQQLGRAGDYRDNETGTHVIRMAHYSALLADAMGYDHEFVELLFLAAPLHDLGKISIPDAILLKPGKLTPQEWEIMQTHAAAGANIIGETDGIELLDLAANIARYHHERWDGSGYPEGLSGTEIPIEARICALADVFDALVSDRPYKQAWTLDEAMNYIAENAGSHFDPDMAEKFISLRDQIPNIMELYRD